MLLKSANGNASTQSDNPLKSPLATDEVRVVVIGRPGSGKTAIAKLLLDAIMAVDPNANIDVSDVDGDLHFSMQPIRIRNILARSKVKIESMPVRRDGTPASFSFPNIIPEPGAHTEYAPIAFFDEKTNEIV